MRRFSGQGAPSMDILGNESVWRDDSMIVEASAAAAAATAAAAAAAASNAYRGLLPCPETGSHAWGRRTGKLISRARALGLMVGAGERSAGDFMVFYCLL